MRCSASWKPFEASLRLIEYLQSARDLNGSTATAQPLVAEFPSFISDSFDTGNGFKSSNDLCLEGNAGMSKCLRGTYVYDPETV
jgi:hypothetical protein